MTAITQFYGGSGVPMSVPGAPEDVALAWRSHRSRLRSWLAHLDAASWSRPTRCAEWDTTAMTQHLVTGAQHVGYTLHQARKGRATENLAGFDSQATAAVAAAVLDGLSPAELVEQLERTDERLDGELDAMAADGWHAVAEAPPGHVPAHVAVNHFLFDSWVHERDLLLPAGEVPTLDEREALLVSSYVLALAGIAHSVDVGSRSPIDVRIHLTDIGRTLAVVVAGGRSTVTVADSTGEAGDALDVPTLVDLATGRDVGTDVHADPATADLLGQLAEVMAS